MIYTFDSFELDTDQFELRKQGTSVALEPQVFALLELLVTNQTRVLSKDEIHQRIWAGRIVSDAALSSRIRSARAAVGDTGDRQAIIKTVRGVGFRFVPEVAQSSSLDTAQATIQTVTDLPHPSQTDAPQNTNDHSPTALNARRSIAVLPLTLLSLDTTYEPLADAISHEITTELSKTRWLRVISPESARQLRGTNASAAELGEALNLNYLVAGTFALFGELATITIDVTHIASRELVWSTRQESKLSDLVGIRHELSAQIANVVQSQIEDHEALHGSSSTENLDAWTSYFRGLRHAYRFNQHDNTIAAELFERAIHLDPEFALAHAGRSFTHFQAAFIGFSHDGAMDRNNALETAERAAMLDPNDPMANLTVGRAMILRNRWDEAGPWIEQSIQLSANNAGAYYLQALRGVVLGDTSHTTPLTDRALSISPLDPMRYAFLATKAMGLAIENQVEDAVSIAEQAAIAPRAHHLIQAITSLLHAYHGDNKRAHHWHEVVMQRTPTFCVEDFFRSFPLREPEHRQIFEAALKSAGFKSSAKRASLVRLPR